ncbi:MAG: tRNA pseudouridine(55) synthase TruB [Porphyromonadaceae bacterium]|nr:tRNA pseudouridine(55) synthase TruB [Porphyromonadaceae bacterium]
MRDTIGMLNLKEGATIYLDKPLGWSSFGLVNKFRYEACRHLGIKKLKVGHAGTLDPLATGVMILCTGKHTKQIESLQQGIKEYIADIRLGQTTPTLDLESEPDAFFPTEHITEELVRQTLERFVGTIEQTPPIFSAVKVDGKRAYKQARKGRDIEMPTKLITVHELDLLSCELPNIRIRVVCGKGTYIRSLARDIGVALGSGGHLTALQRTQVGNVRLENCLQIEDIKPFLEAHVRPKEREAEEKTN